MGASFSVTTEDVQYYPSDVPVPQIAVGAVAFTAWAANIGPYFNLYRGSGSVPPGGRPCLVRIVGGGYNSSTRLDSALDTENADYRIRIAAEFLRRGAVHINASVITGNTNNTYSVSGVSSVGIFFPPGIVPSPNFTGLASNPPYQDVRIPHAYKDAIHLIQHLKHNAATYEINPDKIVVMGDSYSSHCLQWATWRDRANELGSADVDPQYGMSTKVFAMYADRVMAYFPIYDQTLSAPILPNPATPWVVAGTLAAGPASYQQLMSALGPSGYADPSILKRMPIYLTTGMANPAANDTIAVSTNIDPPFTGLEDVEPIHTAWAPSVIRKYVTEGQTRFGVQGVAATLNVANADYSYGADSDSSANRTTALVADMLSFIDKNMLDSRNPLGVGG